MMALVYETYAHVSQLVGAVPSFGDHSPIPDKNTSNWDLEGCNSFFCLVMTVSWVSDVFNWKCTITMASFIQRRCASSDVDILSIVDLC